MDVWSETFESPARCPPHIGYGAISGETFGSPFSVSLSNYSNRRPMSVSSRRTTRSRGSRAGSTRGTAAAQRYDALFTKMQAADSRLQSVVHDNEQLKRDNTRLRKLQRDRVNLNVLDDAAGASDAKVVALQNLHAQKVRALMKSIDKYKVQVKKLSSQNRESSRSRQIQGLQSQLRGAELVADVLKTHLSNGFGMDPAAVNEFVIKKTLGGPKRFRPKSREELILEVESLKRKHERAVVDAKKTKQRLRDEQQQRRQPGAGRGANRSPSAASLSRGEGKASSPGSAASAYGSSKRGEGKGDDGVDYSQRVVELLGQLEESRAQSDIKDRQIRMYVSKVESLHESKKELMGYKDKYERSRGKHSQMGEEVERVHQEAMDLRRQLERAKELNLRLEAEVDVQKEEGLAANQDVGRQRLRDLQKISDLTEELQQVREKLDKAERDAATAHQKRLSGTKKAEQATVQVSRRLQDLEQERAELKDELKLMQAKVDKAAMDRERDQETLTSTAERKQSAQKRRIQTLTTERDTAQKDLVREEAHAKNLQAQMERSEKAHTERVDKLEKAMQRKEDELRKMTKRHAELEFQQQEARSLATQAEGRAKSLEEESTGEVGKAMRRYEAERAARKTLEVTCKKLQRQVAAAKTKCRKLQNECNALRQQAQSRGAAGAAGAGSKVGVAAPRTPYQMDELLGSDDEDEDDLMMN
jgi:hypothetical protein